MPTDKSINDANSSLEARNDKPALPASQETDTLLRTFLPTISTILPNSLIKTPPLETPRILQTRDEVERDDAGINPHANLANYDELEIAKALARHPVKISLLRRYAPDNMVPEGKMRVDAVRARTISKKKAVLIVKFVSPPSFKDAHI